MMNLIPIHDAYTQDYAVAAFTLLAVGNHAFTEFIYHRRYLSRYIAFLNLSTAIKLLLVTWGAILFKHGIFQTLHYSFWSLMCVLMGGLMGYLLFKIEQYSVTTVNRRMLAMPKKNGYRRHIALHRHDAGRQYRTMKINRHTLMALLLSAICEELLFRDYILSMVIQHFSLLPASVMMMLIAILFACMHVNEGLLQVILKCNFALVMTCLVLLTQETMTVLSAHLFFNFYTWHYVKTCHQCPVSRLTPVTDCG